MRWKSPRSASATANYFTVFSRFMTHFFFKNYCSIGSQLWEILSIILLNYFLFDLPPRVFYCNLIL